MYPSEMTIPSDIIQGEIWKYLSVEDILIQCETNVAFANTCYDPYVWRYLLYRDYSIHARTHNPRREYMFEMNLPKERSMISAYTVEEIEMEIKLYGIDAWTKYVSNLKEYRESKIASLNHLSPQQMRAFTSSKEYRHDIHRYKINYLIDLMRNNL